jgi:hypothetical protein
VPAHQVTYLPGDSGEVPRLHLDDEISATDIDNVTVNGCLDLIAGFEVAPSERCVQVSFVENADG